jgi:hypothetical protein
VRKSILAVVFLAFCPLLFAQQALNNDAVIKLVKAGLSDDLIVSTINGSAGAYDTSADGIIALKTAGASDKVVAAIVLKASAPATKAAAPGAAPAPVAADPDDPASPHDPGVYLLATEQGKQKMIFIDRVGAGGAKAHRGFVSASMKAEIPGPHASVRTVESMPTFYMYFPADSGLGEGQVNSISSPTQFSLIDLEDKKDHRETSIAKVGMFSSISYGNDTKKTSLFSTERIRSHVYKITTSVSLKPGEYAFIATMSVAGSATGATVVIYDFGVDVK